LYEPCGFGLAGAGTLIEGVDGTLTDAKRGMILARQER
jgi:hypothetical protein